MSVTATAPPHHDVPELYPRSCPRAPGALESFAMSALAPAAAVIFTNPFDTIKVRLQLQGQQLKKAAASASTQPTSKVYKNSMDALVKIYTNEGMRGLQKGLTPAILREGSKNFFRIGMYDPIMSVLHDPKRGRAPGWKRMLAGSICGMMGAFACNPFELVKTRLQSAAAGKLAVGHQHGYSGVWDALRSIYAKEGVPGLYRGSMLSMSRSIVGSGANLSSYSMMKEYLLVEMKWRDNAFLDMVCGLASGVVSCIFMNPIDVVRTRYYNQPYVNGRGELYANGYDAVRKIVQHEGFGAFYKGFLTHFLRIGPHFCLTFVFLGMFRRGLVEMYGYLDAIEAFKSLDKDGNGVLDESEIESALGKIVGDRRSAAKIAHEVLERADHDHDHVIRFQDWWDLEKEVASAIKSNGAQPTAGSDSNTST